ncbi:hypothetical protein MTR67_038328 [Solanum verrucosum]|uniref:SWIM-type domain-containing protein n=1 Tax=Solanum verrucosum TaxID=315347 RepID=A0AAF0ZPD3_SOLVR|nr:hypothetical protein MTR67_038328 [Solanum verrucosum]
MKQVVSSTEYIYNVTDDGRSFVVCLKNKTCSCEKFQYEEISCEHARAVLKRKSLVADGYCLDLYKLMTILKIYEISIYPLPDVAEWVIPEYIMYDKVHPPKFKGPPGSLKRNLVQKQYVNCSVSKGSIHVAHVKLQVTIGVRVEIGLKKFNDLFLLYWSVILDFIDT